jgi:hypothetical protein
MRRSATGPVSRATDRIHRAIAWTAAPGTVPIEPRFGHEPWSKASSGYG